MSFTITVQDSQPLPTGEYPARLIELTDVEGRYGRQWRLKFEVVRGDFSGRNLIAYVSPSGNPSSKCIRWAQSLMGRALQANEQVDWQSLVGKYCLLSVIRKVNDGGREVNVVQDVLPARRTPTPPPPSEPEPEAEGDPFA